MIVSQSWWLRSARVNGTSFSSCRAAGFGRLFAVAGALLENRLESVPESGARGSTLPMQHFAFSTHRSSGAGLEALDKLSEFQGRCRCRASRKPSIGSGLGYEACEVACHFPVNEGERFSRTAAMPSCASLDSKFRACSLASNWS